MINFQLGAFVPSPASPSPETSVNNGVPRQVQIFGRLPNGKIAAVACDQYGNLAISGGTGGAINTVDLLGNDQAVPVMIYGALPSGEMVAVAVDSFGDLCATVGSGGGNAGTTVDIPVYTMATPVQIFAREPNSGRLIAIPLTTNNYLYDSVHPGTTPALSNPVDVTQNQYPTPVILCGRTPSGHIVAVSLDSAGRLCISGSGSSGSINTVDVFDNGECRLVQIYGRNPNTNVLQSVPLDSNGNLQLS